MVAVCGQAFGLHRYIAPRHVRHASIHPSIHSGIRPEHPPDSYAADGMESGVSSFARFSAAPEPGKLTGWNCPAFRMMKSWSRLKASQDLVPILPSKTLRIDPRLDPSRRYCRPWTRDFLGDISEAYYQQFHASIQVNSAVRTVQVQKKLRRHNRNAAPETGETASSHLAGITVDIQRRGMTKAQVKWMEQYIMPLKDSGLVEPEERTSSMGVPHCGFWPLRRPARAKGGGGRTTLGTRSRYRTQFPCLP